MNEYLRPFVVLSVVLCFVASTLPVASGDVQQNPCGDLVSNVRVSGFILDSDPAVLFASINNEGAPYVFTIDWGDDSEPETGIKLGQRPKPRRTKRSDGAAEARLGFGLGFGLGVGLTKGAKVEIGPRVNLGVRVGDGVSVGA